MGRIGVRQYILFAILVLMSVAGVFVVQKTIITQAAPGINKTINFQGKMTDDQGLNVADGTYQFEFRMYNVASGGSATWTETVNLSVVDGIFHHNLGSSTPLPGSVDFDTDNIYLGITFNSDPDGEMTPRIQLTATPYAFNADQLDGLDASDFLQLSPSAAQAGDIVITGSVSAASLVLSDGSSNTATIEVDSLAGDYTFLIPATTGNDTFCLETLANCGTGGSGVTTIGTIDSQTASSDGGVVSGSSLYLQSASASNPGLVSTGSQTFAGAKTFASEVTVGGTANVAQFTVKLNSAQTAPAIVFQGSLGLEMARLIVTNASIGLGGNALSTSSTGFSNVAIGLYSMMGNDYGSFNTAVGTQSLFSNASGYYNTAVGSGALLQNETGSYNVAIGTSSLGGSTTGEYNLGVGYLAGQNIATGSYNVAIGYDALMEDPDGSYQLNIANFLTSSNYQTGNLVIGSSDTTGQLLVLDTKTDSGDPTGVNGGMYYNSNSNKFRCYEDGGWTDCISSGAGTGDIINGGQNGAITIGSNNANSLVLETNNTARLTISSTGNVTQSGGSLQLSGTSTSNYKMYMAGTVESASGSVFGLQNSVVINASAASGAYGLINTPTIHASSASIADVFGFGGRVDFQSGYAGTVSNAYGVMAFRPSAMNGVKVQNYVGLGAQMSNSGSSGNSDNTSGTLNNYGLRVFSGTAAAGTGGTLNNYGARITLSTGATSGTTNYGLYIDGNGGGSNNWALYSTSTAASLISGALTVGGQLSVGTSNATGTLLVLDTKTGSGDSGVATVNGGMYYNSADGKFRCYENGTWKDCIGSGGGTGDIINGGQNGTMTIGTNDSNSLSFETNNTTRFTLTTAGLLQGANGATISVPGAGSNSEAFGAGALAEAYGVALGNTADAYGYGSVAIGYNTWAGGANSIAIGNGAWSDGDSIAIGAGAGAEGDNQFVLGSSTLNYTNMYLGAGITDANASSKGITLQATSGGGTNVGGASLTLAGGQGTGNQNGGAIYFQTATLGSSGSSLNSLTTRLTIEAAGNVGIGTGGVSGRALQVSGIISAKGTSARLQLEPSGGGTTNLWNIDNNAGTMRFFRADYASTGTGSNGVVRLQLNDSGTGTTTIAGTNSCTIGSGTGTTSCTSDARKKHDIQGTTDNLNKILQLNPVSYYWNSDANNTTKRIGLIAQDVKALFPEAVEVDSDGYYTLDYSVLVSPLIGATKELSVKVSANTAQISVVQSEVATLTASLSGYATTASIQSLYTNLLNRVDTLELGNFVHLSVSGSATIGGDLSVAGAVTAMRINLAGKLVTSGARPLGTVLGATSGKTVEISGNDTAGEVNLVLTADHVAIAGEQVAIQFTSAFDAKPRVNLTPISEDAAKVRYYVEPFATGFKIIFIDTPIADKTYGFNYFVVQ